MKIELPPLPYDVDALEPHISAETLELHHGAHHAGYVSTVNELREQNQDDRPLSQIVLEADGPLYENAAQAWNHALYWNSIAPDGGGAPPRRLTEALEAEFDSLDGFRDAFTEAALDHFGSGWAWLVQERDGRLAVTTTHDAGCPLRDGRKPLLTCDLWEHAYYLDHRNDREQYLETFWKIVAWPLIERRADLENATAAT